MAMPRSKAPPARFATAPGRETGTAALVANDLRHHSAVVVEEAVLNRLPATEPERLGVDREQRLRMLDPALRQRDWVLDEDRLLGQHVLGVHAFLVGVNRLGLVGQENVAFA